MDQKHSTPPLKEALKIIPDIFGMRLNEQPAYTVLEKDGDFEIRHYEKTMLAQATESGPRQSALEKGFQRLADYIFGQNTKNLHNEESHSEKMAMTAPVFHEEKDGNWLISFVLSSKYNLTNVPRPQDSNIQIVEKNAKDVAAVTYSGTNTEDKMQESKAHLQTWITARKIKIISEFYFAQYDPPFAIPVLKRNEVMVKIELQG